MKKIAIDLDGVVFDSENLYRVYTEIYDTDVKKQNSVIDNSIRLFQQRYNWSKEELDNFYNKNSREILTTANMMTGCEIVLPKLNERFELIIVTARNDIETEYAKKKLDSIGLSDIKIYNNEHNKIDRFIEENVDYIIDDDENICINASKNNIYALYFKNNASNKVEENKYLINVNNWGEIYKFIMLNN